MRPRRSSCGRSTCGALVAAAVAVTVGSAEFATAQTTHQVELDGVLFIPDDLTVQPGDTVHWVWVSGFHNVESGEVVGGAGVHDGIFRSGDPTATVGTAFEIVFDEAFLSANPVPGNIYPYFCIVHASVNMTGTITVADAGCVSNGECDDQNACNGVETCQAGECSEGTAPDCDDQNICTDDSCDPVSGCQNAFNTGIDCDDGNVCNGVESCIRGRCVSMDGLDCSDSNPCTDDTCDPQTGCQSVANDARSCNDGDFCTSDECVGGVCIGTPIAGCFSCVAAGDCDDDDPCTDDICRRTTCIHINNAGSCDDGDPCTGGDICASGLCAGESIAGCCVTVADCEAIACMESQCAAGVCARTQIPDCMSCDSGAECDDGNVCTNDMCDEGTCVNESNQALCDDGDPCTDGDACLDGICEGAPTDNCCDADDECDDEDPCTFDACVSNSCAHTAIDDCDDGDMDGSGAPLPDDDGDTPSPTTGRRLCGAIGMIAIVGVLLGLGTWRVRARPGRRWPRAGSGKRTS